MPYADVNNIAKQIPPALDMTLDKALAENPVLKDMAAKDPKVKEVLDIGRRLEGMSRHASVHAAGVVIAPGPITDYAPLYKGQRDEITTQWNMKEVERVGLLKMDFLGLSTLTLIQDCLAEIKRTEGIELDIDTVPLDDPKTYKVFGEGAAYGIFQFESSGMRELLRKAKPERLDDLIALNALYRPGPLKSGMVDDWVARKQGRTEIKYELPQLEPILSDTYGVIAYQEQVMRIAQALAGFSLGQADVLRKAMGKKDPKVMAKQREAFMAGARAKGVNEKKATKIFDLMEYFAGYGFNKSHSTAYAFLAYQTAYLKANYPWHFAAALLTIEAQNTDKLAMYLAECRERGIPVLPPDINESQLNFSVEPGTGVRFGLTAIKGLGEGRNPVDPRRARAARRAHPVAARAVRDPRPAPRQQARVRGAREGGRVRFAGARARDDRASAASIARAAVRRNRRRLRARRPDAARQGPGTERPVRRRRPRCARRDGGAAARGGRLDRDRAAQPREGRARPVPGPATRSIARRRLTFREYGAKTTPSSIPPRRTPRGRRRRAADEPAQRPAGRAPPAAAAIAEEICIGGIVSGLRPLKTRKGDRMCVFMLDDADGSLEVVVFPEAFKQCGHLAENGTMVVVKGKFERDDESARLVGVRDRADRDRARAAGHVGGDPPVDAAARPRDVRAAVGRASRSTRATAAWRSSSTDRDRTAARQGRRQRASASVPRNGWSRRSRRSVAPAR